MHLRQIITEFAAKNDLVCGVCTAQPLPPDARLTAIPFSEATERERRDPAILLPGARSVIVLGAGYAKAADAPADDAPRGVFSAMAVGEDYHTVLARHLGALREVLLLAAEFESVSHVDTGPLCERGFALRAGVGFRGRNQYVLSPRFGPCFNLGLLITTLEIPPDVPMAQPCEGCGRCIEACPGGALSADGFDYTRCASYISQKKGELAPWEAEILGEALYGCDVCARVCPHGQGVACEVVPADAMRPQADDILALTNASFRARFGQTAIGWRGLGVLKRNARNAKYMYKRNTKGGE